MDKKISITTGFFQTRYGDRRALEIAREIGADGVDFTLCDDNDYRKPDSIYSKSDEEIVAYFTALREYAASLGLAIVQTHGRISGYRNDPAQDEPLIENARLDCLATRALGAPVCVMHTVSNTHFGNNDATAAVMHEMNDRFYLSVLPFAQQYDVRIATETYGVCGTTKACEFFGIIPEFIAAYDRLAAHPTLGRYLTVCMDAGHTHNATQFAGAVSAGDAIRRMGSRISILHLHDNNGRQDQHLMPLCGTMDWPDVLHALEEIGYQGYYNLEVSPRHFGDELAIDEAALSIKILRHLLQKP